MAAFSSPNAFELQNLTADFAYQGLTDHICDDLGDACFAGLDSPLQPRRKRGHRRSSSEPLPDMSRFDLLDESFLDEAITDIFFSSDFAGLVAKPSAKPSAPQVEEPPYVPVKVEVKVDQEDSNMDDVDPAEPAEIDPPADSICVKHNPRARGYVCGRCGQPKRGHTCPFLNRPMSSSGTQVDFDEAPSVTFLIARPRSII